MAEQQTTTDYAIVTQVILLRPTIETTDEALAAFFKAVHSSQKHIPCLLAVSTGENHSTAHRGFTHGILLHFDHDPKEAKIHPKYQDLIDRAKRLCNEVLIFELPETLSVPIPALSPEPPPEAVSPPEPKQRGRPQKQQPTATPPPAPKPERSTWRAWSADQIDERLKHIVIDQLDVEEREVVPSASLVEDLNADSLDLVEYIMSVEEAFKVEISDENAEKLTTVGEMQAYLQDKGVL